MKEYTYKDGAYTFKRVDKRTARKAYNNGLRVVLCPCNLRPGYPYHPECSISGKTTDSENGSPVPFEAALSAFEYYNLRDSETGRYTAFYVPVHS